MGAQLSIFDGEARRDAGVKRVAANNADWLERMRRRARTIARSHGEVTADDLRRLADELNDHPEHPNAWGAVFRGACWACVGFRKSQTPSAHARRISVWTLRG